MKHVKFVLSLIIFVSIAIISYQVITKSRASQHLKKDYAELNHFKYGLFSVDTWKEQLSQIVADEIDDLSLTRKNEKFLKSHLEVQLGVLIDKIIERIRTTNNKTPKGWFKQGLMESFVDVNDIKKGVPEYAAAMMAEMKSARAESQIKNLLKEKINQYMAETFDTRDPSLKNQILKRYKSNNEEDTKALIQNMLKENQKEINKFALIMVILAVILFLIEGFNKEPVPQTQYFIMTLTLLILLVTGVTTPMIDMEAKITKLSFVLFDHPVTFENQVLYFQSKSIIDVFWVMITHKEIQMKAVGILMVAFSIVFPVFKMLSSLAYYYDYSRARTYKVVQFFVLKSGKWSMADVLVVAIFMAYIGFNGIINSQLGDLATASKDLEVMTTNGTNLQPGYYIFLTYTILAMFLSGYLKSRPYVSKRE